MTLPHLAAVHLLVACTAVPVPLSAARRDFSEAHFCPLPRVAATEIDMTPHAPPPIARDPERLAMWRRHFALGRAARHRVLARGCDEGQMYSCWVLGGEVPNSRHWGTHYEIIGAQCSADEP